MSLGRRAFLQFVGGAIGGTLLTPIPWKLADDSAIWTQNWSWRPSPERGEITRVHSICQLCPGGCGITARLVNGRRAVAVTGNAAQAVSGGGVCPLGASGLQYLYAPYRIAKPLKQRGARGDLKGFQEISWDEALKEVATKLTQLRTEGKSHTVACVTGQKRSTMASLWRQFLTAYGSPNFYTMPDASDSLRLAVALTTGADADIGFHWHKASFVLSFGAPLLEGWGSPVYLQRVFGTWQTEKPGVPRTFWVHVDSRAGLTASKAHRWIACHPGTEAALALGIAHVLVREKLYDAAFVADKVFGFEDWVDPTGAQRKGFKTLVLAKYGLDEVSKITGVAPQTIQELARQLAQQKYPLVVWGQDKGDKPNNLYHDLAFLALNALLGNLSPAGTLAFVPNDPWPVFPEPVLDEKAYRGLGQPALGRPSTVPRTKVPVNTVMPFLEAVAAGSEYPLELLFVHEANPVYGLQETALVTQAVQKAGMVVSFSSYMDETTQVADLVLPNHNALERLDDVLGLPGLPLAAYALASPILKPHHDTRSTGDVVLSLAAALGGDVAQSLPWKSYEEVLKKRVAAIAEAGSGLVATANAFDPATAPTDHGLSPNFKDAADLWNKLKAGACWVDVVPTPQSFATPSQRYELACQGLMASVSASASDELFLPRFHPLKPSGDETEYPLLLTTYATLMLSEGYVPNAPFMNKLLPDDLLLAQDVFVDIHPETASSLGLADKAAAVLKTPRGEARVRVRVTTSVRPGVVAVPQGFGHTAYDAYVQNKGFNANSLVEVQLDPVTGLGTVWATRAQLRRA